jgi:dihydroorotate dehydrogenase
MPPEKAHYVTLNILSMAIKTTLLGAWLKSNFHNKRQSPVQFCGLNLPNKVGLAAGFDKDARYLEVWKALGFGHAEIGTITPLPQPGNEKPRLFRLPKDRAIINRMGFNNLGLDQAIIQLKNRPKGLIIGGNIGKNKVTPNEKAVDDYLICFEKLYDFVDYFTVNVSSPNTPGLRALQDKDALLEILSVLIQKREDLTSKGRPHRPVLLKIAPDLTPGQLDDIIELKKELNFDGIIANNTTISRERLQTDASEIKQMGAGGLSGAPLKMRSSEVMRYLREHLPETPLIGVGGIMNAQDGKDRLNDGADLIQVYTGFIYAGPGLVRELAGIK